MNASCFWNEKFSYKRAFPKKYLINYEKTKFLLNYTTENKPSKFYFINFWALFWKTSLCCIKEQKSRTIHRKIFLYLTSALKITLGILKGQISKIYTKHFSTSNFKAVLSALAALNEKKRKMKIWWHSEKKTFFFFKIQFEA